MSNTFVTLGRDNPEGWPLELLLHRIADELAVKNFYTGNDASATAQRVQENNRQIMDYLGMAVSRQLDSLAALAEIRMEHSTSGPYRIGEVKVLDPVRPPDGTAPGTQHFIVDRRTGVPFLMRWVAENDGWLFQTSKTLTTSPPRADLGSAVRLSEGFYRYLSTLEEGVGLPPATA